MRRGGDFEFRNVLDPGNPMQTVFDDLHFRAQLHLIIQLLEVAASAAPKILTRRFDSLRRGFNDFDNRCETDAALLSIDSYTQTIARRGETDHYGLALTVGQAEAARQDSFDENFHDDV